MLNPAPKINPEWLDQLQTPGFKHYHDDWDWLFQLRGTIESFVSFGCMTSEPFFLLWALDANYAQVIEREKKYISARRDELEYILDKTPEAFDGRQIEFILSNLKDLDQSVPKSNSYDLCFCRRVLYIVFLDAIENSKRDIDSIILALQEVSMVIAQMKRITRPGGWIITQESIAMNPGDEPVSMDPLFESLGLIKHPLSGVPEDAYCYEVPN